MVPLPRELTNHSALGELKRLRLSISRNTQNGRDHAVWRRRRRKRIRKGEVAGEKMRRRRENTAISNELND